MQRSIGREKGRVKKQSVYSKTFLENCPRNCSAPDAVVHGLVLADRHRPHSL
jgi:hypothetical protein